MESKGDTRSRRSLPGSDRHNLQDNRSPEHHRSPKDRKLKLVHRKSRSVERRRNDNRKRGFKERSPSSSQSSARYRSRRKRERPDYRDYEDEDRRKRVRRRRSSSRGRSYSRRRSSERRPRRRSYKYSDDEERHSERHRRRRRHMSAESNSPESNRRRDRRKRRHRRRRPAGSPSSDESRHAPVAPLPPHSRAGVVSDDDDAATNGHPHRVVAGELKKAPPSNTEKRTSASSSHDDSVGHFKGREGTIIDERYRIIREVGVGTFGRVVECFDLKRARSSRWDSQDKVVAIKIVRNVKRYYESALIEADVVEEVNRRGGRGTSHCAIMFHAFSFAGHYCMVFESLGPSLYDFLKRQNYKPFPIFCVRDFARQLLETLEFLHSFRLIHTDLKPENILLLPNCREVSYKGYKIPESTRIKVIDFGGATYDYEKKSTVVNTRQYRAPEVILGVGWSMPSDLWSVGCILAELYQGELLFATHDNIEHLALIEQVISPFPRRMLKRSKNLDLVNEAFDTEGLHRMERVLSPESLAYVKRIGTLESIVFPDDTWFLRLLRRILVIDPRERATARECLRKF